MKPSYICRCSGAIDSFFVSTAYVPLRKSPYSSKRADGIGANSYLNTLSRCISLFFCERINSLLNSFSILYTTTVSPSLFYRLHSNNFFSRGVWNPPGRFCLNLDANSSPTSMALWTLTCSSSATHPLYILTILLLSVCKGFGCAPISLKTLILSWASSFILDFPSSLWMSRVASYSSSPSSNNLFIEKETRLQMLLE